jgi:hypothetical protein
MESLGDQLLAGAAPPITSTGRSSGAARLARSTASRKEEDWPTNWVLRSIPTYWEIPPRLGKQNQAFKALKSAIFSGFPPFPRTGTRRA